MNKPRNAVESGTDKVGALCKLFKGAGPKSQGGISVPPSKVSEDR